MKDTDEELLRMFQDATHDDIDDELDDDFLDLGEGQVAMVPAPVIQTVVQFIVDNFGECAFETFMEYFPVNASSLLSDNPMFKVGGVELVFSKPFNDLIHLLTHLHPDFAKVMDSVSREMADSPTDDEIDNSMLQ